MISSLRLQSRHCGAWASSAHLPRGTTRLSSSSSTSIGAALSGNPPAASGAVPNHHDLPSFLAYASRVGLPPASSTYIGTLYEYTVLSSLKRLGFSLSRVGGRADAGIDLVGEWKLPFIPQSPLKVLVQCKSHKRSPGPSLVRELEGAFAGAPAGWRGDGVLGVLAATREATRGVRDALGRSRLPLCFLKVSPEGRVEQCLWNSVCEREGLEGVGATVRYSPGGEDGEENVGREIVLTWKGKVVESTDMR
ncbi:hypothetical protein GP486_005183 [Trichoglossum hirsutum]|uniref:Required for respiratory growth protein 7, mitochondrial n=1 Tax=Trichoglossum hirsutum TaxID=265104 RepID=A0A9P8L9M3_9PEZI|nr:hypothetical protein GP486_005183 [Trichoglossum hirsutum]